MSKPKTILESIVNMCISILIVFFVLMTVFLHGYLFHVKELNTAFHTILQFSLVWFSVYVYEHERDIQRWFKWRL
jgi:hypothetical protein